MAMASALIRESTIAVISAQPRIRLRPCSSFQRELESSSFSGPAIHFLKSQSFHSSCGGAGHFSLLVQRKVTKRKHAPFGRALRASCPAGSRAHSGVRRTHIPVRSAKRVHPARAPLRGLILHALAAPGGDPEAARIVRAEAKPQQSEKRSKSTSAWRLLLLLLRAGARRSTPGPRESRPAGGGKSRSDRAHDVREFATCTRMYIEQTPQPAGVPGRQDAWRARRSGSPSLWLLSLGETRESNPLLRRRSGSSGSKAPNQTKQKKELDSSLRWNDEQKIGTERERSSCGG